jgi:hypothetical protein
MKPMQLITIAFFSASLFIVACKEGVKKDEKPVDIGELAKDQPETHGALIKEDEITLTNPLNATWVSSGQGTYELKCQSCHKLTEEKVVGPGWKDVTKKRKPVWVMNMITNTEMMLDSDPEAQKLLELCMVRMPNQNISKDEARQILEFMRSNDGEK